MSGGIYLRCDQCGKTLGWQEVFRCNDRDRSWDSKGLTDAARALGWTGPLDRKSETDRCPECSGVLARDAARYRFLRDGDWYLDFYLWNVLGDVEMKRGDALDAAIDQCIKTAKGERK